MVHLKTRENRTTLSYYLYIYSDSRLQRVRLKDIFLFKNPKDANERKHNSEAKIQAEAARLRAQTGVLHGTPYAVAIASEWKEVIPYLNEFSENYKQKDHRKVTSVVKHFKDFAAEKNYRFKDINENTVSDFKRYLEGKGTGETARAYFGKFSQIMRRAFIDKLCLYDIKTFEARFKIDKNNLKKEVLETHEIQKIANTPCENQTIKLAFIFCCFTGLDFADMFFLKWKTHIRKDGMIKPREKTEVGRVMPLHGTALAILELLDKSTEFVFQGLPHRGQLTSKSGKKVDDREYSWSACDKTLKALIKRAGINKHITWHCARHSFGTNTEGDEGTIAQLLGHSDTKMVKVYRRAKQDRLRKAVDSLKGIDL